MKLSINLSPFEERFGVERAAKLAGDAGFDACDFFLALDRSECVLHSSDYKSITANMRATINANGLEVTQTHAPFRFPVKQWDEPGHFDLFVKTLEISAMLGARVCVVHPLHHMEYLGHEEEIFALNMDYYRRLIPYCKEFGIKVGIENMWQKHKIRGNITFDTCSTIPEFIRSIDTLDSEYMVACLDVGHVVLPDNRDTPADFIRALGHDRLKSLHIHDNDYKSDAHLLPYQGKLDWESITKALGEINYDGDFTYEVGNQMRNVPEAIAADAVKYMERLGRYLVDQIEKNRKA